MESLGRTAQIMQFLGRRIVDVDRNGGVGRFKRMDDDL
jgi:hypothetical protein